MSRVSSFGITLVVAVGVTEREDQESEAEKNDSPKREQGDNPKGAHPDTAPPLVSRTFAISACQYGAAAVDGGRPSFGT